MYRGQTFLIYILLTQTMFMTVLELSMPAVKQRRSVPTNGNKTACSKSLTVACIDGKGYAPNVSENIHECID